MPYRVVLYLCGTTISPEDALVGEAVSDSYLNPSGVLAFDRNLKISKASRVYCFHSVPSLLNFPLEAHTSLILNTRSLVRAL